MIRGLAPLLLVASLVAPAASARVLVAGPLPPLWDVKQRPRGLTYGGTGFVRTAPDLIMKGPYEDRFELRVGLDAAVKYRFAKQARFVLSGRFRYDLRVGQDVEADVRLDLGESYLQARFGKLDLRVGNVLITWGRNALLSPLNVLNPVDMAEALSGGDPTSARRPVPGVRATLNLYPVAIEAVWLPFFSPSDLPFVGRDFALLRPGLIEELAPGLVPQTSSGLVNDELGRLADRLLEDFAELDPYTRDGLQTALAPAPPEEFPRNGDVGLRAGLTGRGVDASLMALWYVLDQPQIRLHEDLRAILLRGTAPTTGELTRLTNPDAELVSSTWHRSLMVGGDVSAALGSVVLSGEAAIQSRSVVYTRELDSYTSPRLQSSVGLRYTEGSHFALDVELQYDYLLAWRDESFWSRRHELQLAALVTGRLFDERLHLLAAASWSILRHDLYLHPRVTVEISDRFRAHLGLQLFFGLGADVEPDLDELLAYDGGLFGYFRGNDQFYATAEFSF